MDDQEKREPQPRLVTKQRTMLSKKEPNKRSTLMNAGMSASRKGLKQD